MKKQKKKKDSKEWNQTTFRVKFYYLRPVTRANLAEKILSKVNQP
jgi:hypothetical protein